MTKSNSSIQRIHSIISVLFLWFAACDSDTNLLKEGWLLGSGKWEGGGGVISTEGLLWSDGGSLDVGTLMWYLKICDEANGLLVLLSNETLLF